VGQKRNGTEEEWDRSRRFELRRTVERDEKDVGSWKLRSRENN
jgi:hypothetical protein